MHTCTMYVCKQKLPPHVFYTRILHFLFSQKLGYSLSKKLAFMPVASVVTAVRSANAPWTEIQQLVSRGSDPFQLTDGRTHS